MINIEYQFNKDTQEYEFLVLNTINNKYSAFKADYLSELSQFDLSSLIKDFNKSFRALHDASSPQ